MFTPTQVSDMLGIPPSTLRRYAKVFEGQLSDQRGRIRRLYSERDILVFAKVHELSKLNQSFEKIKPLLEVIEASDLETKPNALSLIPEIAAEIEAARSLASSALAQLASLETSMLDRSKEIEQLTAQVAQINNYLSLPWWKRLFIRPPR